MFAFISLRRINQTFCTHLWGRFTRHSVHISKEDLPEGLYTFPEKEEDLLDILNASWRRIYQILCTLLLGGFARRSVHIFQVGGGITRQYVHISVGNLPDTLYSSQQSIYQTPCIHLGERRFTRNFVGVSEEMWNGVVIVMHEVLVYSVHEDKITV